MKSFSTTLLFIALFFNIGIAQITLETTVVDTSTILKNIDIPWEITWGPDDHIWMTERYGRVSRVEPNTGAQEEILDLSAMVYENGEAGLLGLALHPSFLDTPQVFIVYTYLEDNVLERLVRYDYDGSKLINPFTIVEAIPGNNTHDGSRLLILPDRTILMTTGDAQIQSLPQNVNSLAGKVLRYNLDGSIPSDNPIPGSAVWSWGHRNAQGLALSPNGNIYSSEHGPTTDDELNILEKGRNYGWPDVHGLCDAPNETTFCNDSNVFEPIANWTPTLAVSDIVWYDHPSIPEFQHTILMTVLKDKKVVRLKLNNTGDAVTDETDFFSNTWGRIRDICVSPTGDIYLATNGQTWANNNPFSHSLVKISNSNHPVGIESNSTSEDVVLWPQPANNSVNVKIAEKWIGGSLQITNSVGQIVYELPINTTTAIIDTRNWDNGYYVISIQKEEQQLIEKLIVSQ